MARTYKQLSLNERITIDKMLQSGSNLSQIAIRLGRHRSTLSRELKRNHYDRTNYNSVMSWLGANHRRYRKHYKRLHIQNGALQGYVIEKLKFGWSPEQICGRLKQKGIINLCHETIYQLIYSPTGKELKLHQYLRSKRKKRHPHFSRRPYVRRSRTSIHDRPTHINDRSEFGHWEGDLVLYRKQKTTLITLRERQTRFIVAIKNEAKDQNTVVYNLKSYLDQHQLTPYVKSLTLDNGSEFTGENILKTTLSADIYYCDPNTPHQKGAIENANRQIRQPLPFETNITDMSQDDIEKNVMLINHRPMKCLAYLSPIEVLMKKLGQYTNEWFDYRVYA